MFKKPHEPPPIFINILNMAAIVKIPQKRYSAAGINFLQPLSA